MAELTPTPTVSTQTDQSVTMPIDMTTAIDATILEDIPFDETPFDESIPPDFGSADSEDEWDEDDLSHEDLRRAPLRKSAGTKPAPSAQDLLDTKEIQLQEEEDARRKVLEGQMTEQEISVMLEAEFGERRREVLRGLNTRSK